MNINISKRNIMLLSIVGIAILIAFMIVFALTITTPKKIFAFPSAEGFGAYTTGGRGGAVYHVKTLEDTESEGSLRYAINQKGARTIVFDVDGIIPLKSPLIVNNGNLTIAGQTSPRDGICLKDFPMIINADNVIMRYVRIRTGEKMDSPGLIAHNRRNIIIDHCSFSWSPRNNIAIYDNADTTIQWSIISESLTDFRDEYRGEGALLGGFGLSIHHNLFADNFQHNPDFLQGNHKSDNELENVDFRNNVISNWGINSAQGLYRGENNIVNNYFNVGPATEIEVCSQFVEISYKNSPKNTHQKVKPILYISGNINNINPIQTKDNWMGVSPNNTYIITSKNALLTRRQFHHEPITMHSAKRAFDKVVKFAGASKSRDANDEQIIRAIETGKYIKQGTLNGLIDSPKDTGGYSIYKTAPPLVDSDNDGMPDEWEYRHNLEPYASFDGNEKTLDKDYTNLEVYLNSLTADITKEQALNYTISNDLLMLNIQKLANLIKR